MNTSVLHISIPADNVLERKYILQVFLDNSGITNYHIDVLEDNHDYTFIYNGKILVVKDSFFGNFKEELSYLCKEGMPCQINYCSYPEYDIADLPIIYGNGMLKKKDEYIICNIDFLASSFFMLTRWEEIVIPIKDVFGRCLEDELTSVKHDFYERPIVNEYFNFLRKLLLEIGFCDFSSCRDERMKVLITHDVDHPFRFTPISNFIKNIAGDLVHRNSLNLAFNTFMKYMKSRFGNLGDPFDTFNFLMEESELRGFKSHFYFKANIPGETDYKYDIFDSRMLKIIDSITSRQHIVGFHPSKDTFHNISTFLCEYERLRSIVGNLSIGRQHYLLYDFEDTFIAWDSADSLEYDVGIGFSSRIGFRAGYCYEYPIFHVKERRQLSINEIPLTVMDVGMLKISTSQEILYQKVVKLIDTVSSHKGCFVLLWHNDNFNRYEWSGYKNLYIKILDYLHKVQ